MPASSAALPIRLALLSVAASDDIDLVAADEAVLVGPRRVPAPWDLVADVAMCGLDDTTELGAVSRHEVMVERLRLAIPLLQTLLQDPSGAAGKLLSAARPLALPRGHALHPGRAWVREDVPGGVLDLGVGLISPPGWPGRVVPLPPAVAEACGVDTAPWWPQMRKHLTAMGEAAARAVRDTTGGILRPTGGCDVPTLLTSGALRERLCGPEGVLRSVAVPQRTRGWFDLRLGDPAFVPVAWSLCDVVDRGVPHGLLVARQEVARVVTR